jgi:hypothetical protein
MPALSAVEGSAVALGEARIWEKPGFRFAGKNEAAGAAAATALAFD